MGFKICVRTSPSASADYLDQVSQQYYSFISSYDHFGDDSVLVQAGKYLGLDLTPLTNLLYLDVNFEDYLTSGYQNINKVYRLLDSFYSSLKGSPEVIYAIHYKYRKVYNQDEAFHDYFTSGGIIDDVEQLLAVLNRYRIRGVERVFFGAV